MEEESENPIATDNNKEHQLQSTITDGETIKEEIEDDLTSLRKKQNQTPLSFYWKCGDSYLFSFNQKQLKEHLLKIIVLATLEITIGIFITKVFGVPQIVQKCMVSLISMNLTLFILLFFMDPGTLFEDQEQTIDGQRIFCNICHLYRYYQSHHCHYCVKCVKGFDHHCGFFGKCIGRRNYIMFAGFLLSMSAESILSMGWLIYSLLVGI